jgi:hypothetical protein
MRERNSNSRMVLRTTAEGGDGFAVVLDFEFPSPPPPPPAPLRHANNEEIRPRSSSYVVNPVTLDFNLLPRPRSAQEINGGI